MAVFLDLPGFQNAGREAAIIKDIAVAAVRQRPTMVLLPIVVVDMSGQLPYYRRMFSDSIGIEVVAK